MNKIIKISIYIFILFVIISNVFIWIFDDNLTAKITITILSLYGISLRINDLFEDRKQKKILKDLERYANEQDNK